MKIEEIEHVLNTPEIIRSALIVDDHKLDRIDIKRFGDNAVWMMTKKGGWSFVPIELGVYECHFGYTKKGYGKFALEHSKQCFENMRALGAKALLGLVAQDNLLAKRFLEKLGCESVGLKEGNYKFHDKDTNAEVYRWVTYSKP